LILAYQGLDEGNLDQKSPGPPGWGLRQQASSLLIGKKRTAKKPIGKIKIPSKKSQQAALRGGI
jgi:hypothetical protein